MTKESIASIWHNITSRQCSCAPRLLRIFGQCHLPEASPSFPSFCPGCHVGRAPRASQWGSLLFPKLSLSPLVRFSVRFFQKEQKKGPIFYHHSGVRTEWGSQWDLKQSMCSRVTIGQQLVDNQWEVWSSRNREGEWGVEEGGAWERSGVRCVGSHLTMVHMQEQAPPGYWSSFSLISRRTLKCYQHLGFYITS